MEKFSLGHTALYFKGWYKHSENIFDDLRKTLEADGYCGSHFSDSECIYCILCKMDNVKEAVIKGYPHYGLASFYNEAILHSFNKGLSINDALLDYIETVMITLSIDCFKNIEPDYTVLPKSFVCDTDEVVRDICYSHDNLTADDDLEFFILEYCNQSIRWKGDFKDENDVIMQTLPVLKKMLTDKKENENEN